MKRKMKLASLMLMASVLLTSLGMTSCSDDNIKEDEPEVPEVFTPEFTSMVTVYDIEFGETLYSIMDLELEYVDAEGKTARKAIDYDQKFKVTTPADKVPEKLDFRLCCKLKDGGSELVDKDVYDYAYILDVRATALDQKGNIYKKFDKMTTLKSDFEITGKKLKTIAERGYLIYSFIEVVFKDTVSSDK